MHNPVRVAVATVLVLVASMVIAPVVDACTAFCIHIAPVTDLQDPNLRLPQRENHPPITDPQRPQTPSCVSQRFCRCFGTLQGENTGGGEPNSYVFQGIACTVDHHALGVSSGQSREEYWSAIPNAAPVLR